MFHLDKLNYFWGPLISLCKVVILPVAYFIFIHFVLEPQNLCLGKPIFSIKTYLWGIKVISLCSGLLLGIFLDPFNHRHSNFYSRSFGCEVDLVY